VSDRSILGAHTLQPLRLPFRSPQAH
jgi:hypothetical protein